MSKRNRRKYSDRERAMYLLALEANGVNFLKTSRETSVPRQTLMMWAAGHICDDVQELQQSQRGDFIRTLEELARQLADALPDKIEAAGLQQTATSMAICIDKARLLSEKATQIVDYRELEAEIEAELRRLGWKQEVAAAEETADPVN